MNIILPDKLNDGRYDYVLVRPETSLDDGRVNVAIYDRVPPDPDHQFTPDLAYCNGIASEPLMLKLQR